MQIEVRSDRNIEGSDELIQHVSADVAAALSRFSDQLTRVEVHLADENARKSGAADKRCTLEARHIGQPPIAVTHHASTVNEAYSGALEKLNNLLESRFGRLSDRKGRATVRHDKQR